jgi:hypothetical protein
MELILHDEHGKFRYSLDGVWSDSLPELANKLIGLYPSSYVRVVRAPDYEKVLAEFPLRDAAEGNVNLEREIERHRDRVVSS